MRPENRPFVSPDDVLLAAHPGSGRSWISTLLTHLDVCVLATDDERLVDQTSQASGGWFPEAERGPAYLGDAASERRRSVLVADQERHLPQRAARHARTSPYPETLRVLETHRAPLDWTPPGRVVLLVRDGRDAVLSLYHNLKSFSGLEASLEQYLSGNDGAWLQPARAWAFFCMGWLGAVSDEHLHVLRFESAREDPRAEFSALLRFLRIERDAADLDRAIEESSYRRMRTLETEAIASEGDTIGKGRVMRAGKVEGWRAELSKELLGTFEGMPSRALRRFGYRE